MADNSAVRPDGSVGEAFRAVARDTLAEARAVLSDQKRPDAAAVHDFRKAMKRWRALLRLLAPFLGEDGERLRAQARDFARNLSGARDAQSALEAVEDVTEEGASLSPRTIQSIRARLDAIRRDAEAGRLTQGVRAQMIVALDAADAAVGARPVREGTVSGVPDPLGR